MGRYAISSEEFTNDLVSVSFRNFLSYNIILTLCVCICSCRVTDFTGVGNQTPFSFSRLVLNQEILDI